MLIKNIVSSIILLSLVSSVCGVQSVEAKSFSSRSSSSSSSVKSSPSRPSSNVKVNSYSNNKSVTKSTSYIDNARRSGRPIETKSIPIKSVVTKSKPPNTIIVDKSYIVPNPTGLPTTTTYSTRYDNYNRPISVPIIIPIGYDTRAIVVPDTYYPVSARTMYINTYDNNDYIETNPIVGVIVVVLFLGVFVVIFINVWRGY